MTSNTSPAVSLFGTFNLVPHTDIARFAAAFDALTQHLVQEGLLSTSRLLGRVYHDGYDAQFPDTAYVIEMQFVDQDAAHSCWAYFKSRLPPVGELHRSVNRQVRDAHFVLCHDVPTQ